MRTFTPSSRMQLDSRTPCSITHPGPMLTLGPMLHPSPTVADSSMITGSMMFEAAVASSTLPLRTSETTLTPPSCDGRLVPPLVTVGRPTSCDSVACRAA